MIINGYNVILTPEDGGGFSVAVPELPGCFTQGETEEEAIDMVKEAIALYLESFNIDMPLRS